MFAASMGMRQADIGPDNDLQSLGADSLAIQEFRWQLQDDYALDVSARQVLEGRSVNGIAARIEAMIGVGRAAAPADYVEIIL